MMMRVKNCLSMKAGRGYPQGLACPFCRRVSFHLTVTTAVTECSASGQAQKLGKAPLCLQDKDQRMLGYTTQRQILKPSFQEYSRLEYLMCVIVVQISWSCALIDADRQLSRSTSELDQNATRRRPSGQIDIFDCRMACANFTSKSRKLIGSTKRYACHPARHRAGPREVHYISSRSGIHLFINVSTLCSC